MYPYHTQPVQNEGSRPQPDQYQQYYSQRPQERQYPAPQAGTPQVQQAALAQQAASQQGAQQQGAQQGAQQPQQQSQTPQQGAQQSQYYQSQYAPYYYQMPLAADAAVAAAQQSPQGQQERYQTASLYGAYGGGYAPTAAPGAAAPGAPGATGRPAAAYAPYPYSNDMMVSMMYQQQQAQQAASAQQQAASAQQGGAPGVSGSAVHSPHIAAQRSVYAPGADGSAAHLRGHAGAPQVPPGSAGQPPLAPMPLAEAAPRGAAAPGPMHRATVSTHLSAIPPTMPVTDPTGQMAPPGIKPRVTTTLWEDEGTTCFQVEARGFCVARREDNDMINGTKLLNVAGMTRGRRDGLLKGERNRHVVKAGAMHLKGVWIPYDRALDFANKERIVDLLYPLFVTDIKSVLYHPSNSELRSPATGASSVSAGAGPAAGAAGVPPQASALPTPQGGNVAPNAVAHAGAAGPAHASAPLSNEAGGGPELPQPYGLGAGKPKSELEDGSAADQHASHTTHPPHVAYAPSAAADHKTQPQYGAPTGYGYDGQGASAEAPPQAPVQTSQMYYPDQRLGYNHS